MHQKTAIGWTCATALALSFLSSASAQNGAKQAILKADPVLMRKALDDFRDLNGAEWHCRWDPRTGLARQLRGGRTLIEAPAADPVRGSQVFLESSRALFGLTRQIDTLAYKKTRGMLHGKSVQFQQVYKGIPVWPARIVTLLDDEGRITFVSSSAWPVGDVEVVPILSFAEARRIVARSHGEEHVETQEESELVIYAQGKGILAWKSFDLVGRNRDPWRHIVDASTGELLERTLMTQKQDPRKPPSKRKKSDKWLPISPESEQLPFTLPGPSDPCDREWVIESPSPADVTVESILTPEHTYWVIVDVGKTSTGAQGSDTQIEAVYAAGINLLPGIEYEIVVTWSVSTWDSYNNTFGHSDVFFISLNSALFFWDLNNGSPVSDCWCNTSFEETKLPFPYQLWTFGGDIWEDGELCVDMGSRTFTYKEDDLEGMVYLSLGLDTGRSGDSEYFPSWGRFIVSITGKTPYFNPNPVATLDDVTLSDDSDSQSAVPIEGYAMRDTPLPNLAMPAVGAPFTLTGDYCTINDDFAPFTDTAYSHDGKFPYLRGCDGFEAVNCYLHITEFQAYLQSLGYTDANGTAVNDRSIEVDPHGLGDDDNSYYVPDGSGTGHLRFGDGEIDDGEDADVIIHEYAHACFDNINVGVFSGFGGYDDDDADAIPEANETSAMSEGSADFLASHYFSDECDAAGFEPAYFAEWDFIFSDQDGLRRLNLDLKYPADIHGPEGPNNTGHTDSQIFSRVLWDLRAEIGGDRVVQYVIESVRVLPDEPTFVDMALTMLSVEVDPFTEGPKPDAWAIKAAFEDRGILRRLRVRAADDAGTAISGVEMEATDADVDGVHIDAAPFDFMYPFNQDVTLMAPLTHAGRDLIGWRLNAGGIEPGSVGGSVDITLNQDAIPAGGFLATAVYETVLLGDFNGDGSVNGADLGMLLAIWGEPADMNSQFDLNNDGEINGGDLGILLAYWTG